MSGKRICARCKFKITKGPRKGRRCQRVTCKTHPYCWQHLLSKTGYKVLKSTIPGAGFGLFTTQPMRANALVAEYEGQRYPPGKGPPSSYKVACAFGDVDAVRTDSGIARYVNSSQRKRRGRPGINANARFVCDNRGKRARIRVGRRAIKATKQRPVEILANYGPAFRV